MSSATNVCHAQMAVIVEGGYNLTVKKYVCTKGDRGATFQVFIYVLYLSLIQHYYTFRTVAVAPEKIFSDPTWCP